MQIIQHKTMKAMLARQQVNHQERGKSKSNWKPYTNMSAGKRRYGGHLLQAHELPSQAAGDVQTHMM